VANLKRILKRFSIQPPVLEGRAWEDARAGIARWIEYATNILDAGGSEVEYDSHQLLNDLQGGNEDERYHLTLDQHAYLAPHESALDPHPQYALEADYKVFSLSGTLVLPTVAANYHSWQAPFDARVTNLRGLAVGGAATGTTINARKNGASNHLSSDLTLFGGSWQDGGAVQNTDYAAGDYLEFMVTGLSSPLPTQLALQIWMERI
jgi:hypothetical protein